MSYNRRNDESVGCGIVVVVLVLCFFVIGHFVFPDTFRIYVPCVPTDEAHVYECTVNW